MTSDSGLDKGHIIDQNPFATLMILTMLEGLDLDKSKPEVIEDYSKRLAQQFENSDLDSLCNHFQELSEITGLSIIEISQITKNLKFQSNWLMKIMEMPRIKELVNKYNLA